MNETRNTTLPDDPRVDPDLVRRVPPTDGAGVVTLVGVVHDHPASIARVRRVVDALGPDVVALELPHLAVPLFAGYAERGDAALGGEMSAALAAATDARAVGIDAPNATYAGFLYGTARTADVAWPVALDFAGSLRTAVACRLAATVNRLADTTLGVHDPLEHDSSVDDDPETQAAAERRHLSQSRALHGAFEPPDSVAVVDDARERSMAEKIGTLRTRGDVVAVVGAEHLDALHDHLVRHRSVESSEIEARSADGSPQSAGSGDRPPAQKSDRRWTLSSIVSTLSFWS